MGGGAVIVKMRCNLSSQVLSDTEGLSDGRTMPERIRLELSGRKTPAGILSVVDQINRYSRIHLLRIQT
jgi:hypothetical protein